MDFSNALFIYRGQARSHSQSHDQLFLQPAPRSIHIINTFVHS